MAGGAKSGGGAGHGRGLEKEAQGAPFQRPEEPMATDVNPADVPAALNVRVKEGFGEVFEERIRRDEQGEQKHEMGGGEEEEPLGEDEEWEYYEEEEEQQQQPQQKASCLCIQTVRGKWQEEV